MLNERTSNDTLQAVILDRDHFKHHVESPTAVTLRSALPNGRPEVSRLTSRRTCNCTFTTGSLCFIAISSSSRHLSALHLPLLLRYLNIDCRALN
ncbi:hypothetical protein VTN77DRAFT_8072 [Rasamsonia byssochlamydoides]|uniref:uncharacterized protein n=1 Tax=Rasamsonia byssochlamydoides TaxID=89139 RepID=UPI003743203F